MTQLEDLGTRSRRADEPAKRNSADPASAARSRQRVVNFLLVPIVAFAAVFLIFQLPKYSSLDPNQAPRPLESVTHYWLLVGHVATGTVALVTVILQLWPWLRRRHPAVHRWIGRIYVFVGAIPSAIFVLLMLPVSVPAGKVGGAMAAILWAVTAVIGWERLRRRRYAEHRRWMLYSFAILWDTPVWGFFIGMSWIWWSPWVEQVDFNYILEGISWGGWIINLFAVQWWIERTSGQRLRLPPGETIGSRRRRP